MATHQVTDLVEQFVDLLAVNQSDVALPEQAAHFPLHLVLVDVEHHHEGGQVVEHGGEQPVLVVLQPLPFRGRQRTVPAERVGEGRDGGVFWERGAIRQTPRTTTKSA